MLVELAMATHLTLLPAQLNFGVVPTGAMAVRTVTVLNNSDETIYDIHAGGLPFVFQVMNHCIRSLEPGESCRLDIAFRPFERGIKNAFMAVTSSSGYTDNIWIFAQAQ